MVPESSLYNSTTVIDDEWSRRARAPYGVRGSLNHSTREHDYYEQVVVMSGRAAERDIHSGKKCSSSYNYKQAGTAVKMS